MTYTTLVSHAAGAQPRPDDMVMIRYTGWRRRSGETFFTTGSRRQTIAIDIAHASAGLREALPLLHLGEKVVLWPPPRDGSAEPVVYEVELVDIIAREVAGAAPRMPDAKQAAEVKRPPGGESVASSAGRGR